MKTIYTAYRRKRRKMPVILKILLILAVVCVIIIVDSRYRLVTSEYELYSSDLPAQFDGLRIVHLSDLHVRQFGENNERLVDAVAKASPDIIALTGDFIESAGDIAVTETLVGQLVTLAPVFFVAGNHDWASDAIGQLKQTIEGLGAVFLDNKYLEYSKSGESIIICGAEDPNGYADSAEPDALVERLRGEYPDSFVLLLGHRNYWVTEYPQLDVDVILCGHGHGGIIRLPLVGGLIGTNGNLFPDYVDGVHTSGSYQMVVSRGLSGVYTIPRFLNNPEIVTVILRQG